MRSQVDPKPAPTPVAIEAARVPLPPLKRARPKTPPTKAPVVALKRAIELVFEIFIWMQECNMVGTSDTGVSHRDRYFAKTDEQPTNAE